jgi:hypothetical protein
MATLRPRSSSTSSGTLGPTPCGRPLPDPATEPGLGAAGDDVWALLVGSMQGLEDVLDRGLDHDEHRVVAERRVRPEQQVGSKPATSMPRCVERLDTHSSARVRPRGQ